MPTTTTTSRPGAATSARPVDLPPGSLAAAAVGAVDPADAICPHCERATYGDVCPQFDVHGDRSVIDLLLDPETPVITILQLRVFTREQVVALARRRPQSYCTREAAINALSWYWYAAEVKALNGRRIDEEDPAEHLLLTEPARAVLEIEDLSAIDVMSLAGQLSRRSADYYLLAELATLMDHPLFDVRAAYEVVEYVGRLKWGDHPATDPEAIVDLLQARGYPARTSVEMMRRFRVGRLPRLFADITDTPGIEPILCRLSPGWSGKLSDLVSAARAVLATT